MFVRNLKIELCQDLMCRAMEYWLEQKILRFPCRVSKMVESRVNETSTFAVEVQEETAEKEQDPGSAAANFPLGAAIWDKVASQEKDSDSAAHD